MSMSQPDAWSRIAQLNDRAVQRLVAAHAARTDEPLVLAVRYRSSEEDVYLLEVIENFPGEDDDELLATEFEPSAELLTVGNLRILLRSPGQLRAAVRRADPGVEALKTGSVVHSNGSAMRPTPSIPGATPPERGVPLGLRGSVAPLRRH